MLNETLRTLRKQKGYSQEEVASRLNVVRQTVSKWEKGLSVPDADMLIRIAELFEISVPVLLGAAPDQADAAAEQTEAAPPDMHEIAEQLSRINEQLVVKNRRAKRVWKIACSAVLAYIVLRLVMTLLTVAAFSAFTVSGPTTQETSTSIVESLDSLHDALPIP